MAGIDLVPDPPKKIELTPDAPSSTTTQKIDLTPDSQDYLSQQPKELLNATPLPGEPQYSKEGMMQIGREGMARPTSIAEGLNPLSNPTVSKAIDKVKGIYEEDVMGPIRKSGAAWQQEIEKGKELLPALREAGLPVPKSLETSVSAGLSNASGAMGVISGTKTGGEFMSEYGANLGQQLPGKYEGSGMERLFNAPWLLGLADAAGGLFTVDNLPFLAAGPLFEYNKIVSALASMGFGSSMLPGLLDTAKGLRQAAEDGDWKAFQHLAGSGTGQAILAALAFAHAGKKINDKVLEGKPLTTDDIKELKENLSGSFGSMVDTSGKKSLSDVLARPVSTFIPTPKETPPEKPPTKPPASKLAGIKDLMEDIISGKKAASDLTVEDIDKIIAAAPPPEKLPEGVVGLRDHVNQQFLNTLRDLRLNLLLDQGMAESPLNVIDIKTGKPTFMSEKEAPLPAGQMTPEGVPAAGKTDEVVPGKEGEPIQRNAPASDDLIAQVAARLPSNLFDALQALKEKFKVRGNVDLSLDPKATISNTEKDSHGWHIELAGDRHDPVSLIHEFFHVLEDQGKLEEGFVFDNNAAAARFLHETRSPISEGEEILDRGRIEPGTPLAQAGEKIKPLFRFMKDFFNAPSATAGRGVQLIYNMIGSARMADGMLRFNRNFQKLIDYMEPRDAQDEERNVRYIDLAREGKFDEIDDPIFREAHKMFDGFYDEVYKEAARFHKDLPYIPGFTRRMWKVVPNEEAELAARYGIDTKSGKPMAGSTSWNKQRYYQYLADGIKAGGVPLSTNAADLFGMYWSDVMKYISAKRMIELAKETGMAVHASDDHEAAVRAPGYVKIPDRLTETWYKDKSGNFVRGGQYYLDPALADRLGAFLSRDWMRASQLGRSMLAYKNVMTQLELGFSAFHYGFIENEASASAMGQALARMVNSSIYSVAGDSAGASIAAQLRTKDRILEVLNKGLRGLAGGVSPMTSLAALDNYRTGKEAMDFAGRSAMGLKPESIPSSKLIEDTMIHNGFKSPSQALEAVYKAGGDLRMSEAYKTKMYSEFEKALDNNDLIGASLKAVPGLAELISSKLFEDFIPKVKVGFFFNEVGTRINFYEHEIEAGKISLDDIAREAWRTTENRFGEMDFTNLFMNNGVKSMMQFIFRSMTWRVGSLRQYSDALLGQMRTTLGKYENDPSLALRFRMHPDMAWALSVGVVHAMQAAIIQWLFTGKPVQDAVDVVFPRVGGLDATGHENRIVPSTYVRDAANAIRDPTGYLQSGLSSPFGRTLASLVQGHDYYGERVSLDDPNSLLQQMLPTPFSFSSAKRLVDSGAPLGASVGAGAGLFTKAPSSVGHTPDEQLIEGERAKEPAPVRGTEEFQSRRIVSQAKRDLRYGTEEQKAAAEKRIENQTGVSEGVKERALKDAQLEPYDVMMRNMKTENLYNILDKLSDEAIRRWGDDLDAKINREENSDFKGLAVEKRAEYRKMVQRFRDRKNNLTEKESTVK